MRGLYLLVEMHAVVVSDQELYAVDEDIQAASP
jgi:hypothetical protein